MVSRFELFAGRATDEGAVNALLQPHREIAVDRAIAELAGRIRREDRLEAADALIAATALEYRLALMTRNLRDFGKVRDLRVRDPKSL